MDEQRKPRSRLAWPLLSAESRSPAQFQGERHCALARSASKLVRVLAGKLGAFDRPLGVRGHDQGPVLPEALHARVAYAQERRRRSSARARAPSWELAEVLRSAGDGR